MKILLKVTIYFNFRRIFVDPILAWNFISDFTYGMVVGQCRIMEFYLRFLPKHVLEY